MKGLLKHERLAIFERDHYRCRYCGVRYVDKKTGKPVISYRPQPAPWERWSRAVGLLHIDHVIPKVLGGPTVPWNLVTACRDCNLKKYDNVWEPIPLEEMAA